MSYRPISMQANRFRTDIVAADGMRLRMMSVTRKSLALVEPQSASYRVFLLELHRRLAGSQRVTFRAGLSPFLYGMACVAVVLVALAIAGLLIRALLIGSWSGALFMLGAYLGYTFAGLFNFWAALFMLGFAALFTWQIGGFLLCNRPEVYAADHVPTRLLPDDSNALKNDSRILFLKKMMSR